MKKISFLLSLLALLTLSVSSCKKDTTTPDPVKKVTQWKGLSHNLKGVIKGTMKTDSIYYLLDNVTINKGDTLIIQRNVF